MGYEAIKVERQNRIATVTLNRPPMNPLNSKIFRELDQAFQELEEDKEVKAVILTGAGEKASAAGADVSEMASLTPVEAMEFSQVSLHAFRRIENFKKPTIAALNGLALGGGCELSLCCDFRVAADTVKLGQPEVGLGIIPGGGATQRLPRLLGQSKAKEILFFGEVFDVQQAEKIGLVNKVVPAEKLTEEVTKMAEKLAAHPAVAMSMLKAAINIGNNMDLDSGLDYETKCFGVTISSKDSKEGLDAFINKRKPNYQDC